VGTSEVAPNSLTGSDVTSVHCDLLAGADMATRRRQRGRVGREDCGDSARGGEPLL